MDEKGVFLEKIRKALDISENEIRGIEQCPGLFSAVADSETVDRVRYRTHVEKQALLNELEENSLPLGLKVHTVGSGEAASEKIVELIHATKPEFGKAKQIIQHDSDELVKLGLWKRLAGEAVQVYTSYPADPEIRDKTIASYIGITAPTWIIADSATIVQLTKPGEPRSTSLLPSIHIAVIRLKFILADLGELYALLQDDPPQGSMTFITGPSKTADIEAHLVHGAHGPKEMHLIVIDERLEKQISFKGSGLFSS